MTLPTLYSYRRCPYAMRARMALKYAGIALHKVTETFDPEKENTIELQQMGWQNILNNFKKYVE